MSGIISDQPGSYLDLAKRAKEEVLADLPPFDVRKFVDKILKADYSRYTRVQPLDNRVPAQNISGLKYSGSLSQSLSDFKTPTLYKV